MKHLHIWWWLLLPCAYFIFCVFVMKLMKWANEHENFDEIPIEDDYDWGDTYVPEAVNDVKGTTHRARGSYMEDCQ
jgi:hypothetical protein